MIWANNFLGDKQMNDNNENASVGVTFKFGNKHGVSAELGVVDSNPRAKS